MFDLTPPLSPSIFSALIHVYSQLKIILNMSLPFLFYSLYVRSSPYYYFFPSWCPYGSIIPTLTPAHTSCQPSLPDMSALWLPISYGKVIPYLCLERAFGIIMFHKVENLSLRNGRPVVQKHTVYFHQNQKYTKAF